MLLENRNNNNIDVAFMHLFYLCKQNTTFMQHRQNTVNKTSPASKIPKIQVERLTFRATPVKRQIEVVRCGNHESCLSCFLKFAISDMAALSRLFTRGALRLQLRGHKRCISSSCVARNEAIAFSQSDESPNKVYAEKISKIVDDIAQLNLLEVADLNELLKKRLNISDAPVMMGGGPMVAAPAAPQEEEEEAAPVAVQTSFTIKMEKFDDSKKVALIKEIKNQVEGMNLVQAKKFVESCPAVVKTDIGKEEAEKLKQALEAAGATCTIE